MVLSGLCVDRESVVLLVWCFCAVLPVVILASILVILLKIIILLLLSCFSCFVQLVSHVFFTALVLVAAIHLHPFCMTDCLLCLLVVFSFMHACNSWALSLALLVCFLILICIVCCFRLFGGRISAWKMTKSLFFRCFYLLVCLLDCRFCFDYSFILCICFLTALFWVCCCRWFVRRASFRDSFVVSSGVNFC